MTKLQMALVGVIVVAGIATPLVLRQQSLNRLKEQNLILRQRLSELTESRDNTDPDAPQLPKQLVKTNASSERVAESSALDTDKPSSELLQLRGDIARLREQIAELEEPTNIYARYRIANSNIYEKAGQDGTLLTKEEQKADFPRESWVFSGYATPKAAMLSLMWALSQGDARAIFDSYSPEALKWKREHVWAKKSDSEIAAKMKAGMDMITAYRAPRQSINPNGTVTTWFTVEGQSPDGRPLASVNYSLERVGNEWKCCNQGLGPPGQP